MKSDYKEGIYNAYINHRMSDWKSIIDKMSAAGSINDDFLLELINYQYGYIGWCIGNKRNDEARKYLQKAESVLDILSEKGDHVSMVNSYKAAFYGYKIGLNKTLAPILGLKSIDCAGKAIKADADNYFAYIQNGNIEFYMPSVFGGSKKKALEYYLTAEKLIIKNKESDKNWNYISLLTVIAQSYYYLNDYRSAKDYIEKIMRLEPDFGYAKNELYPMIMKKLKK